MKKETRQVKLARSARLYRPHIAHWNVELNIARRANDGNDDTCCTAMRACRATGIKSTGNARNVTQRVADLQRVHTHHNYIHGGILGQRS